MLNVHAKSGNAVAFTDAVLLLKTWLRQRHMGTRREGTLSGFHASMILAHLINEREVGDQGIKGSIIHHQN